jgi:hypothetical protein
MVENKMGGSSRELPDRLAVDAQVAPTGWRAMATAPRDENIQVLLLTKTHGVTEARWGPGQWDENMPEGPREYSGAVWVCGDDAWQIEVEELPDGYHDGDAVGWLPRAALPETPDGATAHEGDAPLIERLTPNTSAEPVLPEAPKVKRREDA